MVAVQNKKRITAATPKTAVRLAKLATSANKGVDKPQRATTMYVDFFS